MSLLGRSVLFGLVFVAALLAVAFGLRRLLREAPAPAGRGAWAAVRRAFWSAAALLLGTSAVGCPVSSCYEVGPEDVEGDAEAEEGADDAAAEDDGGVEDDVAAPGDGVVTDTAGDASEDDAADTEGAAPDAAEDDAAGAEGAEPDAPGDVPEPDAMCYDPAEFDAGAEATGPDGGKGAFAAETRRARRTLARASAVAALLRDPETHPAVREALRRDLERITRAARRARRTLRGGA